DYLCQIKDVVSGVILAWSMSKRMKSDLVIETISKAMMNWTGLQNYSGNQIRSRKSSPRFMVFDFLLGNVPLFL
ncbi:MAG: hypothetical protein LBT31_03775, partial [Synergistaceae bacterium]|nr:hypothetical protein [Synergistaceae bacterium]